MFEGMALGVLVSANGFTGLFKWTLGFLYPFTTPLGILIGICVRNSFNENDNSLIVTRGKQYFTILGILNSLSAGILIYTTYSELIVGEINKNKEFMAYSSKFKWACFFSMYFGASAMAILGNNLIIKNLVINYNYYLGIWA